MVFLQINGLSPDTLVTETGEELGNKAKSGTSGLTGEAAVSLSSLVIQTHLGWIFRAQTVHDHGIDAHVESMADGEATGRVLALQIKGGFSHFSRQTAEGWYHPVPARHARYWVNHSLPVVVVLVDLPNRQAYWVHITPANLIKSGKNFKVMVPRAQNLDYAKAPWQDILAAVQLQAEERFQENLEQLPPSCARELSILRSDTPTVATLMAAFLVSGSGEPSKTVRSILEQQREWLNRSESRGYLALAAYAEEHEAMSEASAALELSADYEDSRRSKRLALAALCLLPTNAETRQRYEALLAKSISIDPAEAIVYVCSATENPGLIDEDGPCFDRNILDRIQVATDVSALALLAGKAVAGRNESRAIGLYEECLQQVEQSSDVMTELAKCYLRRSQTPDVSAGDLDRAAELAEKALVQRRKWTTKTAEPLIVLIRALGIQHHLNGVLRHCMVPPFGTATENEAANPEVARIAAATAMQLGRKDLVDQILSGVGDKDKLRQIVLDLQGAEELSSTETIASGINLLDTMVKPYDYELQARVVMRLALLGVDRTLDLAEGVRTGAIPAHYPDFISAVAKSQNDPKGSLKELRRFINVEMTAADLVIEILMRQGASEEAIATCERAAKRFHSTDFIKKKLGILRQIDRLPEAERLAQETLALSGLTGATRTSFKIFLAEAAASREEWSKAATLYGSVLAEDKDAPESVLWNALICESNDDQWKAARSLLDRHDAKPQSTAEVRLWAQIHNSTGWTAAAARMGISLARKFEGDAELATSLIGSIITYTKGVSGNDGHDQRSGDRRPVVPGDIHASAFAVLKSLMSTHGDSLALKRVDASLLKRPEELRELFSPDKDKGIVELAQNVLQAKVPLGTLAMGLREPYALVVSKRPVGVRVASSPDSDIHAEETAAAMDSLGRCVVLEASTLELTLDLGNFAELQSEFSEIKVPQSAIRDSVHACAKARSETATVAMARWDVTLDRMVVSEADPAEQIRVLTAVESINQMLGRCVAVDVSSRYRVIPESPFAPGDATWLDALELAGREGISLWSDDLALRSLARSLGIPAFGTVNLVEGLRQGVMDGLDDTTAVAELALQQHAFVRALFSKGVVDQPLTLDDLLEQIETESAAPGVATVVLSRPAWWRSQGSIDPWLAIRDLVHSIAPDELSIWQRHTMEGIALWLQDAPHQGAVMLAAVALIGCDENPNVASSREGLVVAAEIAKRLGLEVPLDCVAEAAAVLNRKGLLPRPAELTKALLAELI